MKKSIVKAVAIGLLGTSLLVGCSSQSGKSSSSSSNGSAKHAIGFAVSTLNNPFFVAMRDGAQKEADSKGVNLIVNDGNNDAAKQLSQIQDLIQQKVEAIILNPVSSQSLTSAVQMANKANIPVITLDRSVEGGKIATFIASDNVAAGKMAADQLIKALVELQGVIGTSAERDREQGFDKEIATAKGIQIVAKQPADFDRSKALNVMQNILQSQPDVKGIFAQNDEMALGALKAVQASNKKDISIIGIDGEKEAISNVQNGTMYADIAQQPAQEGVLGVDNSLKLINKETVKSSIPSPLQLVNKGTNFVGF
jgi:ribose transport system substrate-binding protein